MSVFYRKAYEAACRGVVPAELRDEHFETWKGVDEALRWLPTDEQRSDAIYGDWLMQMNQPGSEEKATIKNLLIGNGALAANYLAELAQNANDAAEGKKAEVRVILKDNWLVFTNNGRKVTPDNQIGLCRFFKHVDPLKPALQVIGQFGVGFKSSFRIANEVFVHSWEGNSGFAFRLPISTESQPESWPDENTQERIVRQLSAVGVRISTRPLAKANAGFCTPESLNYLPEPAEALLKPLRSAERGTAFCFHLHTDGAVEVSRRIQGQKSELDELCPIFLPYLRTVQLGANEMRMIEGHRVVADEIPNLVEAIRITLATTDLATKEVSNSRFWRLKGIAPGDMWQVALHADSEDRLRIDRADEELGVSLRSGAAYAYFPLSDVVWPFRFHLHINLQPNLSRGDWNPNLEPKVRDQIGRAVAGMLRWLEKHKSRHHPNWRVEHLIELGGDLEPRWAKLVYTRLREELREIALLKSLWGIHHTTQEARTVRLIGVGAAATNWVEFCSKLKDLDSEFPLIHAQEETDLGVPELPASKLKAFFLRAAQQGGNDSNFWRAFVAAAFSAETLESDALLAVCQDVPIEKPDRSYSKLGDLFYQLAGSTLTPAWHEQFHALSNWLKDEQRGQHAICGRSLREQVQKLAKPLFNPTWTEIIQVLNTPESWAFENRGDSFWKTERSPCPVNQQSVVIHALRVKDGTGIWKPITEIWLPDTEAPKCFHGVVKAWDRGSTLDSKKFDDTRAKIKAWNLWSAWEDGVEQTLKAKLGSKLGRELVKHSETIPNFLRVWGPFEEILDEGHKASTKRLDTRWQGVVKQAEVSACELLLKARGEEIKTAKLIAQGIESGLRDVLTFWGEYELSPWWLTLYAVEWLIATGLWKSGQHSLLTNEELKDDRKRQLARDLLANYYKWANREITPKHMEAIEKLCETEPPTLRGNWAIGLSVQRREFVRNLINPDVQHTGTESVPINGSLLKLESVRWHNIHALPAHLRTIKTVAHAALQINTLELKIEMAGSIIPSSKDEISLDLIKNPLFPIFAAISREKYAAATQPINLEWVREGQTVAQLRAAPFIIHNGHLLTHNPIRPAEEAQYNLVLANYGIAHKSDEEFHLEYNDSSKPRSEIYDKFRKRIVTNARKQNVDDAGYRVGHILRELLQNAESAYASKAGVLPEVRDFIAVLMPQSGGANWLFTCRHHGRAFNEVDHHGAIRKDIDRIVSTPNEDKPFTHDEVGRFNRGFKSVFLVTETVTITSGHFKFAVRDLLLLTPAPPIPPRASQVNYTEFSFSCQREKAFKLVDLSSTDESKHQRALSLFGPSSFVFLKHITMLRIQMGDWQWQWILNRGPKVNGWTTIEVAQSYPPALHRFISTSGETAESDQPDTVYRFAAALKVDDAGVPCELEKSWQKIHLTFPTDDEFQLGFLINGDFATDAGRQGIQLSSPANMRIIEAAYSSVVSRLAEETEASWSKAKWLGWARMLKLRQARAILRDRFPNNHDGLIREAIRAEKLLFENIPHGDVVSHVSLLEFPSRLLRRLAPKYGAAWGLSTSTWIDKEIEEQLPSESRPTTNDVTLDDFVKSLATNELIRARIQFDLCSPAAKELKLDALERRELDHALRLLTNEVPDSPLPSPQWNPEPQPRSVQWLWEWWASRREQAREYTLDGVNLKLICRSGAANRDELVHQLRLPSSVAGKNAWYRLLGLACLMSASFGSMVRLRQFWYDELESCNFWEATAERDFSEATRQLFGRLVQRQFTNSEARGERADYWRHVFYDIRKIHELVWEKEFAETVLELAIDPSRSAGLIQFLKSGQLAGQKPWSGVLGQSAGSPLFFVGRELRRLNIIPHADFDRQAFFPCAPVRRAAQQIGWIDRNLSQRSDFQSLSAISEKIYMRIMEESAYAKEMIPYYDIPLLHLGLEGMS